MPDPSVSGTAGSTLVDAVLLPASVVFPGNVAEAAACPTGAHWSMRGATPTPAWLTALTGDIRGRFAPTNAAFAGVDTSMNLTSTLLYHVLPVEADSGFVVTNFIQAATTATAQDSDVSINGEALTVDEANIVRVGFRIENGVIHIIDSVLSVPNE